MIDGLKINEELKQRYYEQGLWGAETLADAWHASVREFAQRSYVADDGGARYTYAQVDDAASRLAGWLREQDVVNGDVVTFQMPKWAEFAVLYVACLKVGAVMHPIDIRSTLADALYNVDKARSAVFVCPTAFKGVSMEDHAQAVFEQAACLKAVLLVDRERGAQGCDSAVFSEVLAEHVPCTAPPESSSDEVACILTTSGTTGPAKMALLTHNAVLFSERSYGAAIGLSPDDVAWMASPLNHATGFFHGLLAVMLTGGSTVLQRGFCAQDAVALINREGCTWSHGAAPFIYDLLCSLDETGEAVPTLRTFLCGGAPVPSTLVAHAREHGILLCESYGSTESCPHVYVPPGQCAQWGGAYSGIPYDHIEVKVVDGARREVAPGVQGEEASRGPHLFAGYLDDVQRTDEVLDDEGWFYSGDLCVQDEQGRIRINGRKKEIIIRGGENLSVHEIDERIAGCPGIGDHATIGMPDERLGERICTFAVPCGEPTTHEQVIAYLASRGVPKRFWPERLEFIGRIPHTATGKVKRYELAKELLLRMSKEAS